MKHIFRILCILAFILPAKAASPSYENFWPHDFITNGAAPGKIRVNITRAPGSGDIGGDIISLVGGTNYWHLVGNDLSPTVGTSVTMTNVIAHTTLNAAGAMIFTGTLTTNMVAGTNDVSSLNYDVIRVTGFNASTNGSFLRLYAPGNGLGTILVVQNYSAGSGFTMFNNSECAGGDPTMIMRLNGDWTPNRQGESIMLYNYGQGWAEIGRTPTQSITYNNMFATNIFVTSFTLGGTTITTNDLWTTVTFGGITNLQPVNLNLQPTIVKGLAVGTNTPTSGLLPLNLRYGVLESVRSEDLGDQPASYIFVAQANNNTFPKSWFGVTMSTNSNVMQVAGNDGVDQSSFNVQTANGSDLQMFLQKNSTNFALFYPTRGSTAVPYFLDTDRPHTITNLFEVRNFATNVADVDYRGTLQLGRATSTLFPVHAHAVESVSDAATGEPEDNGFYFKSFNGAQATTMDGGITSTAGTISLGTTSGGDDYAVKISSSSGGLAEVGWFKGSTGYGLLSPFLGVGVPIVPPFWLRAAVDHTTNSIFEITNATTLAFAVKGNSGYDGTGNLFLSSDGTYKAAGGGPGGATLWYAYTGTDAEGGTLYGTASTNSFRTNTIAFADNYLTNLIGDYSSIVSIGYPGFDPKKMGTNNGSVFGIGDFTLNGSTIGSSFDIVGIGTYVLSSATITNSYRIYGFGKDVGYGMNSDNSFNLYGFGDAGLSGSKFTNSNHIQAMGQDDIYNSVVNSSFDIYALGRWVMNSTAMTNSSKSVFVGNEVLYQSTVTNMNECFALGSGLRNSTVSAARGLVSIGYHAGDNITGAWTNVVLIGDGSTIGATGQDQVILGTGMTMNAPGGFISGATDAAVAITATGITNALGKNAMAYFDGTTLTFTLKTSGNSPFYTNTVSVGHAEVMLQNGEALMITAGSGTGVLKAF